MRKDIRIAITDGASLKKLPTVRFIRGAEKKHWKNTNGFQESARKNGDGRRRNALETDKAGRKETTKKLSELTVKLINPLNDSRIYWTREVTFDYATGHRIRVDFMKFEPVNNSISGIEKGDFFCYEIKSSVEDFHSKNGHNFIGDYNYYVMPEDVFSEVEKEIPRDVGVYTWGRGSWLQCTRKARRKNRTRPVAEMLLMMFRSAARDRRKVLSKWDSEDNGKESREEILSWASARKNSKDTKI